MKTKEQVINDIAVLEMQLSALRKILEEDYPDVDNFVPPPNRKKTGGIVVKTTSTKPTVASTVKNIPVVDKTPRPAIISQYQVMPLTAMNFSKYWRALVMMFHPNAGMMVALTTKDMAQLKNIFEKVDKFHERLYHAVGNWEAFTEHCREMYGAFPLPKIPTLGFVQKNVQGLVSFKLQLVAQTKQPATGGAGISRPKWSKK